MNVSKMSKGIAIISLVACMYSCRTTQELSQRQDSSKVISHATHTRNNKTEISIRKVWNKAPHSAFTDLLKFKGTYYLVFREGTSHISIPDGIARVLTSKDAHHWVDADSIKIPGKDIRDPKISVTPDGKLMLFYDVETQAQGKVVARVPHYSLSDKQGEHFGSPVTSKIDPKIGTGNDWIWRLTWNKGFGYGVSYQEGKVNLVRTKDGNYFESLGAIPVDGLPNESTVRFDKKGQIYVLIRREQGNQNGVLATTADPAFKNWQLHEVDQRLGGPNFFFLDDSTIVIGSRLYPSEKDQQKQVKTHKMGLMVTDLSGKILKVIPFEQSGGDNSYPGLVLEKQKHRLLVSYYSSHEGKTSIYIATVPMQLLQPGQ